MAPKLADKRMSPDDQHWGYEFGVEGLMSLKAVRDFLSKSDDTIDRLVKARRLRRRKDGDHGWGMFCRRSVTEYIRSLGD